MELKELNYLITLANEGNISRAAEKLYMAQSSLSHFIKQLETELNTTLFIRTSRGIKLTDSGKALVSHAKSMMVEYQAAKNEISDIENLQTGEIRFGISTFRGTYILPSILKKFHQSYPGISVTVTESDSLHLEHKILDGSLDMALIVSPSNAPNTIITKTCIKDEVCLIASPGHPIMKHTFTKDDPNHLYINIKDISDHIFIYSPSQMSLGNIAREVFKEADIFPKAYSTTVSPLMATAIVRSEIGVAFSYYSWSAFSPDIVYISITPKPVFVELALAYPSGGYRSKACKAFGDLFYEYGRNMLSD